MDELVERLASSDADDALVDTVLAAADGDDALDRLLGGEPTPRPAAAGTANPTRTTPVDGVYLGGITVEGFRGIGAPTELRLTPGPGLTVVIGRNGSGKSSLAEALEVALTGSAHRFQRSAVWRDGWRNAHHGEAPVIRVDVHLPGTKGTTTIERRWAADAALDASSATTQTPGRQRAPLSSLGWDGPLTALRPFLNHAELESFLEATPSQLHDRLGVVLGLEPMEALIARLDARLKPLTDRAKAAAVQRKNLAAQLTATGDPRATAAATLLAKRTPPIDDLRRLTTGPSDDPTLNELMALRAITPLDLPRIEALTAELVAAADAVEQLDTPSARSAHDLAELLRAALGSHARHVDVTADTCPVCGTDGALGGDWAERATAQLDGLDHQAAELAAALDRARRAVHAAATELTGVTAPATPALDAAGTLPLDALRAACAGLAAAVDALRSAGAAPSAMRTSAAAIEDAALRVEAAQTSVRDDAAAAAQRLEAVWRQAVGPLSACVDATAQVIAEQPVVRRMEAAIEWSKAALVAMRNERLDPIRERARQLWELMRQQSNVGLKEIRFEGTSTRRKVLFDVTVDGEASQALGVMSQGSSMRWPSRCSCRGRRCRRARSGSWWSTIRCRPWIRRRWTGWRGCCRSWRRTVRWWCSRTIRGWSTRSRTCGSRRR